MKEKYNEMGMGTIMLLVDIQLLCMSAKFNNLACILVLGLFMISNLINFFISASKQVIKNKLNSIFYSSSKI